MSRKDTETTVTLHGEIKFQSAKAVLIIPDVVEHEISYLTEKEEKEGLWIPLSQIKKVGPNYLVITEWIAKQKGIQL